MAKYIFKPYEIIQNGETLSLGLIEDFTPVVEEVKDEYTGPTKEELEKEAEDFKSDFEKEKQKMLEDAETEAKGIVERAEEAAFQEVKNQNDQAQVIKKEAEEEAKKILEKAKNEAAEILEKANKESVDIKNLSQTDGFTAGHMEGFNQGSAEVEHLIERMHKILANIMSRREAILLESEAQIVELVILVARKVVKVISEGQKDVITQNVLAALKKVKTRGNVTLRVNLDDLALTRQNADGFIRQCENVTGITVLEDASVGKGGCVVETDFGAVDARIVSQLNEIENKILEVAPVKTIEKRQD